MMKRLTRIWLEFAILAAYGATSYYQAFLSVGYLQDRMDSSLGVYRFIDDVQWDLATTAVMMALVLYCGRNCAFWRRILCEGLILGGLWYWDNMGIWSAREAAWSTYDLNSYFYYAYQNSQAAWLCYLLPLMLLVAAFTLWVSTMANASGVKLAIFRKFYPLVYFAIESKKLIRLRFCSFDSCDQ